MEIIMDGLVQELNRQVGDLPIGFESLVITDMSSVGLFVPAFPDYLL